MLAELLMRLLTPAGPARPLDLAADAVALWSRATRRRRDWAPHEARCHALVRAALRDLPRRRTAVVLGSGLCRDVPLDDLAHAFETVLLVDAVHLLPLRRRAARLPGVRLVTRDLSGTARWLAGESCTREDPLADLVADPGIDLVISANLLSQLPLAPERLIEAGRAPHVPADLAARIVAWHLADLARVEARVCLLTDVTCLDVARASGQVLARLDLMRGAALPPPDETWRWTAAPPGEVERDVALVHEVHGYRDLAEAWRRSGLAPPQGTHGLGTPI